MIQFKENTWTDRRMEGWKDRWKDGQTLFYRTLLATARGPKIDVPSAYSFTSDIKLLERSFIYIKTSDRPKKEPCSTPALIVSQFDH